MEEKNYILELCQGRCDDPRARIIKAALEEFGLYSFLGARTREIAAKAGVNHAAISYYFGGKTELWLLWRRGSTRTRYGRITESGAGMVT